MSTVTALKAVAGMLLLAGLIYGTDLRALQDAAVGARGAELAGGLALVGLATVFEIGKLHALLARMMSPGATVRLVLVGTFLSNFFPSQIGADVYKVYAINRRHADLGTALLLVFLDRLSGMAFLALAGLLCLALSLPDVAAIAALPGPGRGSARALLWLALAAVPATALGLAACKARHLARLRSRLAAVVAQGASAARGLRGVQLAASVTQALLFHVVRSAGFYLLLRSFDEPLPWHQVVVALAGVMVVSSVPLAIGALGLREAAFVVFLGAFGVTAPVALAVGLLARAVLWAKSLAGGVLFVAQSRRPQVPLSRTSEPVARR